MVQTQKHQHRKPLNGRNNLGGGGVHGYNALEGTFLGGCIFSGRIAGRAV